MEVVGKSKANIVLETRLEDSCEYFEQHERILKCNPYCTNVSYLEKYGLYQWVFTVDDPRGNPIVAVFYVRQECELVPLDDKKLEMCRKELGVSEPDRMGRQIRWVSVDDEPDIPLQHENAFVGRASAEICLLHQEENRTSVHFETDIALDFELSFPLNMMPEGVLKFMSDAVMSQIMQKATESMLCQLQSDICCEVG